MNKQLIKKVQEAGQTEEWLKGYVEANQIPLDYLDDEETQDLIVEEARSSVNTLQAVENGLQTTESPSKGSNLAKAASSGLEASEAPVEQLDLTELQGELESEIANRVNNTAISLRELLHAVKSGSSALGQHFGDELSREIESIETNALKSALRRVEGGSAHLSPFRVSKIFSDSISAS